MKIKNKNKESMEQKHIQHTFCEHKKIIRREKVQEKIRSC
jgi:hypothetical protein